MNFKTENITKLDAIIITLAQKGIHHYQLMKRLKGTHLLYLQWWKIWPMTLTSFMYDQYILPGIKNCLPRNKIVNIINLGSITFFLIIVKIIWNYAIQMCTVFVQYYLTWLTVLYYFNT